MNTWTAGEDFNETSLLGKKAFVSELDLKDGTDEDYTHYKKSV